MPPAHTIIGRYSSTLLHALDRSLGWVYDEDRHGAKVVCGLYRDYCCVVIPIQQCPVPKKAGSARFGAIYLPVILRNNLYLWYSSRLYKAVYTSTTAVQHTT